MTSDAIERKLVAIVSADVAGYSRLMSIDEVETVRTLTAYRQTMSNLVDQYGGRVVDSPGDNALLEFPSATDAVDCAIEFQETISAENAEVDSERRMEFRIGVHLGEVMVEGERIYGDGVNVAARLEAMADVGGICLSKSIRDQVETKVDALFTDLGEQTLKNIRVPIQAFRVDPKTPNRQAILSGGVADFSALRHRDEPGTLSTLRANRTATDPIVLSHGGRFVQTLDDSRLYQFPSAVDAVKCATDVQALMAHRNEAAPEGRRMQYQLGIHLGEVDTDDVGTTMRIQQLCDPGGVFLSDSAYQTSRRNLPVSFVDAGTLTDSDAEIRLWKLESPGGPVDEDDHPETEGPGAIAVLPFESIGNDPAQEYLVDGITDDVTTALSDYREHRVVPRSTAFAFKESALTDREIARELDAAFVLRASVRSTDQRVRVSAELIDAESGDLVWSERFDRDQGDVLDLQEEIASSITARIAPAVVRSEVQRSLNRTDSVSSWDLMQRGKWHYYRTTKKDFDTAIDLYRRSIDDDPANGQARTWLCLVLMTRIWHGWSDDVAGDYEFVHQLAAEAIRQDGGNWRAHTGLAVYYMFQTDDFDRAKAEARYGERWEPAVLGAAFQHAGEHEVAIDLFTRELQINPLRPDRYHWTLLLSLSHYMLGNYAAALAWAEESLELNAEYIQAVGFRAASLAQLGREDEARGYMKTFLEQFPGITASRYKTRFNFRNDTDIDLYMDGLIKAGMPAEPADPKNDQRFAWLAVLPFENLGGDPDQQYVADGIAEDVITGLSRFRSLRLISRPSSFTFRDTVKSSRAIAEELGVRYVLNGSVRQAGDRIRVNAHLTDTSDEHHIWAERYDEASIDIFDLQDRITNSIVAAIDPAIREEEAHRSRLRPDSLDAWGHVQKGWHQHFLYKHDANRQARREFEAAIELDDQYAQAHAGLSSTHSIDVWLRWSEDDANSQRLASEAANRAVELDPRDAMAHIAVSFLNYTMGRMDMVKRASREALDLNPSLAAAHMMAGGGLLHSGDPEAGIEHLTRALELSPRDPLLFFFFGARSIAHFLLRDYDKAISDASKAIGVRYGYLMGRVMLVSSLVESGDIDRAREELTTILEIAPDFTHERLNLYAFEDPADKERIIDALRTAGLET